MYFNLSMLYYQMNVIGKAGPGHILRSLHIAAVLEDDDVFELIFL